MTTKQVSTFTGVLTGAALVISAALWSRLPELIPIHWGLDGQVDGWAPRIVGALLGPGMLAAWLGLFHLLPRISPRQFEVESFRETYNYLMALIAGLLGFIHVVSLAAALWPEMPSGRILVAGIMLMFVLMGNVLGRTRRNFWIGIRTPWTLASDRVWAETHRLAGRLMVAAGLAAAVLAGLGYFLPAFLLLIPALLIPVFHSLWLYRRLE